MTQRNDHWQLALHRGQLQSRVMSRQARAISVQVKTYDRVASCRGRNPLGRIRGTGPIENPAGPTDSAWWRRERPLAIVVRDEGRCFL